VLPEAPEPIEDESEEEMEEQHEDEENLLTVSQRYKYTRYSFDSAHQKSTVSFQH
jgi:hypothetical protein